MFKHRTTGELVVKPRLASHTKLLLIGTLLVVTVGGGVWIYNYGLSMAGFESSFAAVEREKLKEDIRQGVQD